MSVWVVRRMQADAAAIAAWLWLWRIRRWRAISGSGPPFKAHSTAWWISGLGLMNARRSSPNVLGREFGTEGFPSSLAATDRIAPFAFFNKHCKPTVSDVPLNQRIAFGEIVQSSQRHRDRAKPGSRSSTCIVSGRLYFPAQSCSAHKCFTICILNVSFENMM